MFLVGTMCSAAQDYKTHPFPCSLYPQQQLLAASLHSMSHLQPQLTGPEEGIPSKLGQFESRTDTVVAICIKWWKWGEGSNKGKSAVCYDCLWGLTCGFKSRRLELKGLVAGRSPKPAWDLHDWWLKESRFISLFFEARTHPKAMLM